MIWRGRTAGYRLLMISVVVTNDRNCELYSCPARMRGPSSQRHAQLVHQVRQVGILAASCHSTKLKPIGSIWDMSMLDKGSSADELRLGVAADCLMLNACANSGLTGHKQQPVYKRSKRIRSQRRSSIGEPDVTGYNNSGGPVMQVREATCGEDTPLSLLQHASGG